MRKNLYFIRFLVKNIWATNKSPDFYECGIIIPIYITGEGEPTDLYAQFVKTSIDEFKTQYGLEIKSTDIQWKTMSLIDSCVVDEKAVELVVEHAKPVDGCYYWIQLHDDGEPIQLAKYCGELKMFYVTEFCQASEGIENVYKWFPKPVKKPITEELKLLIISA